MKDCSVLVIFYLACCFRGISCFLHGRVNSIKFNLQTTPYFATLVEKGEEPAKEEPIESSKFTSEIKYSILAISAGSDRGQSASTDEHLKIASLVDQLQSSNPTDDTTTSEYAYGTWELIYSSTQLFRSSPFFMAGRAVCQDGDEADRYDWFCDMHRAALAISNIGKVRQIISKTKLVSEFEVKVGAVPFVPLYSGGWPVTIDGAIVSSADIIDPAPIPNAYTLFMDKVEIKGSNVPVLRQILNTGNVKLSSRELGNFLEDAIESYSNPKPIFETTYLDNEGFRISRDQDGKIFIYRKVSEVTEPTDYSNISSDLGVSKLLENFNDKITKVFI